MGTAALILISDVTKPDKQNWVGQARENLKKKEL